VLTSPNPLPELQESGPQVRQQGEGHPVVRPDQGAEGEGATEAEGEGDPGGGEAQTHGVMGETPPLLIYSLTGDLFYHQV